MYYVKASDQKANQLSSIGLSEDRMEIWSSLVAANSEKFKIKAVKIPNKDNIGSWDVQLPEPAKFSDSFKSAITWIKEHITPEWKRKFADALTQELKKPKVYMVLDQSQEAWQVETEDADMSL